MKTRIVKIEWWEVRYAIQRKFLFFWVYIMDCDLTWETFIKKFLSLEEAKNELSRIAQKERITIINLTK